MKFKVGDKVKVIRVNGGNTEDEKCLGKIFTIKSIMSGYGYPYIFEEYRGCAWCDEEVELAPLTKADLKDGMVVEYRDGRRRMVLGDNLIGENGYAPLRDYNENLEEENYPEETIAKVYKSQATLINCLFYDTMLEIIWERPEEEPVKKMTVAEIEKELGYKVEIVSEN